MEVCGKREETRRRQASASRSVTRAHASKSADGVRAIRREKPVSTKNELGGRDAGPDPTTNDMRRQAAGQSAVRRCERRCQPAIRKPRFHLVERRLVHVACKVDDPETRRNISELLPEEHRAWPRRT